MPYTQETMTPVIPLLYAVHQIADEFCQAQADLSKAEQVYLNTLAVYVVHEYLEQIGFSTSLETSNSWNPIMQSLINTADLEVKNYGRLECRPVLPDVTNLYVPPEAWNDRVGFVAVQINASMDEATLLGFIGQVETENVPVSQLQPIEELAAHLGQIHQSDTKANPPLANALPTVQLNQVQLGQWLQGRFEAAWQTIEAVISPPQAELAWSARGTRKVGEVSRVKVLEVGQASGDQQIALLVKVTPTIGTTVDITIQIHPTGNRVYLPGEVQVRLLTESAVEIGQARATISETIQLQFQAEQGESFQIEVMSGGKQLVESFIV